MVPPVAWGDLGVGVGQHDWPTSLEQTVGERGGTVLLKKGSVVLRTREESSADKQ